MDNKISVIVPVFNIESYIKRCVDSILSQTYPNIEIILVDDGSTDNSGHVIDEIAISNSSVKVLHKKNGGVTSARLEGVKIASGDWITFVDGDDYIEPDMYEVLMKKAIDYQADISHCGYQMVFPSRVDYYYNTHKQIIQNNQKGLVDLLSGIFIEPGLWNKLYKAEIVSAVVKKNIMDSSIKINEDLLLNYYFFRESKKSVYFDFCPYHYIVRTGSAANSEVSRHFLYDPIEVQKTILKDVSNNKELTNIVFGRLAGTYINGAAMTNPGEEAYIDEYIKICRQELKKIKGPFFAGNRSKISKIRYHLCSFSPALYRAFHKIYAKARGTDNKYEVR